MDLSKFTLLALFTALCTCVQAADRLKIDVYPRIVQAGGYLRLTCRVPRQAENRQLVYGITNYLESERDLEGENSKVTWEAPFDHVPCESGDAYCRVVKSDGSSERVVTKIVLTGCDEGTGPGFPQ